MPSRMYRALLRLFPGEFRGDFAAQMAADFEDQRRDAEGRPRDVRRLWVRTAVDMVRSAPREHLDVIRRDAAYALRGFRRHPVSTATIVFSLALGVGLNAAVFSVMRGVLWRDLPFRESDRLVLLQQRTPGEPASDVLPSTWIGLQQPPAVFESLATSRLMPLILLEPDEPRQIAAQAVDARFFDTLRATPVLGRRFTGEEYAASPGQIGSDDPPPRALILGHALWMGAFGGDPEVVGRILRVSGGGWIEVVGVMGPEMDALTGRLAAAAWVPGRIVPGAGGGTIVAVLGRLAPEVSLEQARVALANTPEGIPPDQSGRARTPGAIPLLEYAVGGVRTQLTLLFGAVVCVLLVACANVVSLLLAGSEGRRDELATRVALGASRSRLVRLSLTESVVLAAAGGLCGLLLAWWTVPLLVALAPSNVPRLDQIALDAPTRAFTALLSAGVGVVCGTIASLASCRFVRSTPDAARSIAPRIGRLRQALVAAQIAVALVLAVGTMLMVRSVAALEAIDPGFDPAGVIAVSLPSPRPFDIAEAQQMHLDVHARVVTLPGVRAAGIGVGPLLGGMFVGGMVIPDARSDIPEARVEAVSPGYFEALGARLLAGRFFDRRDLASGAAPVVLVNATAARAFWGDAEPLGKVIMSWGIEARVVGVVADMRGSSLETPQGPAIYQLSHLWPYPMNTLLVRVDGDAEALAPAIRSIVRSIAPEEPFGRVAPLQERIDRAFAPRRFVLRTIGFFSIVALVLAVVGVYAVLADLVTRRTPEVGIRIALGATPRQVLGLIARQGVRLAAAGLISGVAGAVLLRDTIMSMLYAVEPIDPASYALAIICVLAAVATACAVPARRAARIDPVEALRLS